MGSVLHKGKWVDRYGLSCGYWSNRPNDVDEHLMRDHVRATPGQPPDVDMDVYDLMADQYQGQPLHKCTYKRENTA